MSARLLLTAAAFIICGVWGSAALFLAPFVLMAAARADAVPVGLYLLIVANVVLPFTLMAVAFRMRRPRTTNA